ncbi:Dihydroneopterin aldolase [Candidatus Hartigia pinicola]|nr:Dihydroneopterin aldolase [Candidatus Hartigia pinicola]
MDIVFIKQLSITTTIGTYDWEQKIKQTLVFDIEMGWDITRASMSDNIMYSLDYETVSQALIVHVSNTKYNLVERVAEEVAQLLLKNFNCPWVKIKVTKPGAITQASQVGVIIERNLKVF